MEAGKRLYCAELLAFISPTSFGEYSWSGTCGLGR